MIINLPVIERSEVMPSDIPQVPNADVISNNNATIETFGSVIMRINNATMKLKTARKITANERKTSISLICRLKI